ncbi:hypothetical protein N5K21_22470 [Rhizobium pusense]|jgi:hypothetical protein|uniref:Uncharacterized protein n=1 Tax=Agrobacterium pusense TaxID=648995 RepID=A0A6H0ZPU0_9HYPH|nr:hypothetical protein [Agrobacterium pusense]MDH2091500.1 hypothetical protein [Agrobacterium pusense]QIX22639.1 hypothetical protein FOB41_16565 [Agrobacterium pusense]WCK24551.1 hypothetical protein CFBP5496_0002865 [Agrobacterium pusense]
MSEENWYRRLVERFGSAVPAAAHLQIRADLQPIVDDLFAELADFHHACRVYGIVERDEGLVVIDARFLGGATDAEKKAINEILEQQQERLND